MEGDDLYRELQRHLDCMPVPYPATESGVELRILTRLFTPEEARVALLLSAIPEPLDKIHRRTQPAEHAGTALRLLLRLLLWRVDDSQEISQIGSSFPD